MRRFPSNAIGYCLEAAGIKLADIDHVAFYDKPFLKFERLLETYLAFAPRGFRSFQHGDAAVAQGEAVPEEPAAQGAEAVRRRISTWQKRCCSPNII